LEHGGWNIRGRYIKGHALFIGQVTVLVTEENSTMKKRFVDIFAVILLTLISVALAFAVPPDNVAGRIWILPLVLVLPGYALSCALFAKQPAGIPERVIFSLGLSLSIVILCGLLLNLTPFGMHARSWAVLLGGITIAASAIALVRRRGQSGPVSGWSGIGRFGFTFRQGLLLGLAALVVGGAVVVSVIGAEQQPRPGFTQLWILPSGGASTKNAVRLGVSNMETTAMDYRLDVNIDGKVVKEWPSINLHPEGKWEVTFVLPSTNPAGNAKVEADLYRTDVPGKIYRSVVLWLNS
jgi:uncharacterized membrane protein